MIYSIYYYFYPSKYNARILDLINEHDDYTTKIEILLVNYHKYHFTEEFIVNYLGISDDILSVEMRGLLVMGFVTVTIYLTGVKSYIITDKGIDFFKAFHSNKYYIPMPSTVELDMKMFSLSEKRRRCINKIINKIDGE